MISKLLFCSWHILLHFYNSNKAAGQPYISRYCINWTSPWFSVQWQLAGIYRTYVFRHFIAYQNYSRQIELRCSVAISKHACTSIGSFHHSFIHYFIHSHAGSLAVSLVFSRSLSSHVIWSAFFCRGWHEAMTCADVDLLLVHKACVST